MDSTVYDVVIVGAGPAGVEAALQSKAAGLSYVLLDRDIAGSLIERTMAHKRFFHAYGRNTAKPIGLIDFPDHCLGHELVACWHKQLEGMNYIQAIEVRGIKKEDGLFRVETNQDLYQGKHVVLSSGTFQTPRTLGVPGEEGNMKVVHQFDYGHDYGSGPFVVVGGGNSALEAAIELGFDEPVTLVVRKDAFRESVTDNNKDELQDLIDDGKVTVVWSANVTEVREDQVLLDTGTLLPFSYLFVHVGFHQPTAFLSSCGIQIQNDLPVFDEDFQSNVPGLYIAGSLTGADSVIESANQAHHIITTLRN